MLTDRYYTHSGRYSPLAAAKALGLGLVVAVPMAFVYSYAIVYIPIVGIITFILTAGFAAVVGFTVGHLLKSGQVRNNAVSIATAGIHRVTVDFLGDYGYSMDDLQFNQPGPPGPEVPEPATLFLMGSGLVALVGVRRRAAKR